jgi:hypothetical protein
MVPRRTTPAQISATNAAGGALNIGQPARDRQAGSAGESNHNSYGRLGGTPC